jgi:hypothetical protein
MIAVIITLEYLVTPSRLHVATVKYICLSARRGPCGTSSAAPFAGGLSYATVLLSSTQGLGQAAPDKGVGGATLLNSTV